MTDITWRRVREGEYESEAGSVWQCNTAQPGGLWRWYRDRHSTGLQLTEARAKAACEAAWRRAQEGKNV